MKASLRHIAVCVSDLEKSARFYEKVFELKRVGEETLELGSAIYLSDGVMNLALLHLKEMKGAAGTHHFGFVVDDVEATQKAIEAHGGKYFFTLGHPDRPNYEVKFKDPDGVVFDISKKGWLGTE